jgi:hypothetical protein
MLCLVASALEQRERIETVRPTRILKRIGLIRVVWSGTCSTLGRHGALAERPDASSGSDKQDYASYSTTRALQVCDGDIAWSARADCR